MTAVDVVVADAIDRACDGLLTLCQANERLIDQVRDLDPADYDAAHVDALRAAVCFERMPDGTFRGDFAGGGPIPWPRTLAEMPADVLDVWRVYAERVCGPALRAHLHDLLKEAGSAPVHVHARAAIAAYREAVPVSLAAAEHDRGRLNAVRSLTRALALAAEMNQRELRQLVVQDILSLVTDLLAAERVLFGLVIELLEALHTRSLERAAVRDLIEHALSVCSEVWLQLRLLQMLREMDHDPMAQKDVDRRIVTAMIDQADRTSAMLRHSWLEDAATTARNAGLPDLFEAASLAMQDTAPDSLGLVPTGRLVVQLSAEERHAALAEVDEAADLATALWNIVGTCPPAGTIAAAQQEAREVIPTAPLASLIARGALNPAGPVSVAPASSDALANVQADHQLYALHKRGLSLVAQLDRVCERFNPGELELATVFAHPACGSPSQLRMLVRSVQFYWAGHDDAAVHLALPRVEALLREIERARGTRIVAVAKGDTPGGVSQLGSLIDAMPAAGFDEDWQRSFALLFTDAQRGLNLRNNVSHGLRDCPPRPLVALVLHAVLFLLAVAHGIMPLPEPPDHARDPDTPAAGDAP